MKKCKNLFVAAVFSVALFVSNSASAATLTSVSEGFNPGGGQYLSITGPAQTSADTGYDWSGHVANGHGIALDGSTGPGEFLDMSAQNASYDDMNAWTIFGGDIVTNLKSVMSS